jgi:RHS repeat-associated protein
MKERIYLGGFEVHREYGGDGVAITLERETLHVMDDKQRIAMVESRTIGDDGTAARLVRYQIGNHLGSATVELDETGRVISYEEYFPYGSTSYQAMDSSVKAAAKRYRYTGMESDEETGLAYHGARYYSRWLGRWSGADPTGIANGLNAFRYVDNHPIISLDRRGEQEEEWPTLGQLAHEELGWGSIYDAVQSWPEKTMGQRAEKSAMSAVASLGTVADYLLTAASHPQVAAYEAVMSIPFNQGVRAARLASYAGASPGEALLTGVKTTAWGTANNMTQPLQVLGKAAMLGPNAAELAHQIVFGEPLPIYSALGLASPTLTGKTQDTLMSALATAQVVSEGAAFMRLARPAGLQYALAGNTVRTTVRGAAVYEPLPGRAYLMLENTDAPVMGGLHQRTVVRVGPGQPYAGFSFGMEGTGNPLSGNLSVGSLNGRPALGRLGNGVVYEDVGRMATQTAQAFRLRGTEYAAIEDYMSSQLNARGPYNALTNSCRNFSGDEFFRIKSELISARAAGRPPNFPGIANH